MSFLGVVPSSNFPRKALSTPTHSEDQAKGAKAFGLKVFSISFERPGTAIEILKDFDVNLII